MDRNGQVRKEPTLADLEAFEQLLRESLQAPSPASPARPAETPVPVAPVSAPQSAAMPSRHPDEAAMAELARLIETPVDFITDLPPQPAPAAMPAPAVEHIHGHVEAQMTPGRTDWIHLRRLGAVGRMKAQRNREEW